ncbi:MAG: hypothetical protein V1856_00555 [Candidatus Liptonbacteria bacterium]
MREKPLSFEEWVEIIQARADRIASAVFDRFTIPTLTDTACLREGGSTLHTGRIGGNACFVSEPPGEFSPETQGIFIFCPSTRVYGDTDSDGDESVTLPPEDPSRKLLGTFSLVGLTRRPKRWVLVRVAYNTRQPGHDWRIEYATQVRIWEEKLPNILELDGIGPIHLLRAMTEFCNGLETEYRHRLSDIEAVWRPMAAEDQLLLKIPWR